MLGLIFEGFGKVTIKLRPFTGNWSSSLRDLGKLGLVLEGYEKVTTKLPPFLFIFPLAACCYGNGAQSVLELSFYTYVHSIEIII